MFDDDQETPNTLNCAFEYTRPNRKPVILEFEVRHWITNHEAGIGAARPANAAVATSVHGGLGPAEGNYNSVGNIFYGPKGYLAIDNVTGYESYLGREKVQGLLVQMARKTTLQTSSPVLLAAKRKICEHPSKRAISPQASRTFPTRPTV